MDIFKEVLGPISFLHHQDYGVLIAFDEFIDYLQTHAKKTDKCSFKKYNIESFFGRRQGFIISLSKGSASLPSDNTRWTTPHAILKYCYKHSEDIAACLALTDKLETHFFHHDKIANASVPHEPFPVTVRETNSSPQSILELYKIITKTSFRDAHLETIYRPHLSFNEAEMQHVYHIHKHYFNEQEWQKILFFEHDFALSYGIEALASEELDLGKRLDHFQMLSDAKKFAAYLLSSNRQTIKRRILRKEFEKSSSQMQFKGVKTHSYDNLDHGIHDKLSVYFPDICIFILPNQNMNTVDICLKYEQDLLDNIVDIAALIGPWLYKKHYLFYSKIFVIEEEALKPYYREELKGYARHILWNDLQACKLQPNHLHQVDEEMMSQYDDLHQIVSSGEKCELCFDYSSSNPLNFKDFDLIREWLLDVPQITQLLFESCINTDSLRKCKDIKPLVLSKIYKLYMVGDIFHNIYNKNYSGILQEGNTTELMMHSKCFKTVFEMTSSAGIGQSRSTALKNLEQSAVDESVFYNTFIKEHGIIYKVDGKLIENTVSLRSCVIIFMIDNLVRLKCVEDPNPGENRSKQLNTLPITIQGIPADSDEVRSWHSTECDGSKDCPCKEKTILEKEDLLPITITLLPEEEIAAKKFSKLCTWGYPGLIKRLSDANLIQTKKHLRDSCEVTETPKKCNEITLPSEDIYGSTSIKDNSTSTPKTPTNLPSHSALKQFLYVQNTPVSSKKYTSAGNTCSPEEVSTQLRPFTFNTMSPLQGKVIPESSESYDDYENAHLDPSDSYENDMFDPTADEFSLARVIGAAMNDNYDLREHENEIYSNPVRQQIEECSATEDSIEQVQTDVQPKMFGLTKYCCGPLLYLHPAPANGRDDCPEVLAEVCDNLLQKMGYSDGSNEQREMILFGPDHKIGNNFLKIRKNSDKYKQFLLELALLHVRKHKITVLFSAYKDVGLIKLLQLMRDSEESDWKKLLSVTHIDAATHQIRRLSVAFHLAFLLSFIDSLPDMESAMVLTALDSKDLSHIANEWDEKYQNFIFEGCKQNATFCLHYEIMKHLDDVVAVALSERLGGPDGYNLLLASMKSSLLFSFLNGAQAYAPYTLQLLVEHYQSSSFHRNMKMALFSTPRPGSAVNFSTDTKREMDHLDVLKGFRSGSTLETINRRMSIIDSYQQIHQKYSKSGGLTETAEDRLGWDLNEKDWKHILPTVAVIMRRGGLSQDYDETPKNVYARETLCLDPTILDSVSAPAGIYLLQKSACMLGLLGLKICDIPKRDTISGPKHLIKRAINAKSTIRRVTLNTSSSINKTQEEIDEVAKDKALNKEFKQMKRRLSKVNTCQALLNHDGTKPKVNKSATMPAALAYILQSEVDDRETRNFITLNQSLVELFTREERQAVQFVVVELAGIKFKIKSIPSGKVYIEHIQQLIEKYVKTFPQISSMVICEEKYSFTPDVMKQATRDQRKTVSSSSIAHLKQKDQIMNDQSCSQKAIVATNEGKLLISTYLAEKASTLNIHHDIDIIIDSEYKTDGCQCTTKDCLPSCAKYSVPISCKFSGNKGLERIEELPVKQRKGEGEMSQVDWLIGLQSKMEQNRATASIVTSGDIDAVVIHLFAISHKLEKDQDNKYTNPVYVILIKQNGKADRYNITSILEYLEEKYQDQYIGIKVAIALGIGGNDFLPKYNFYGSHRNVMKLLVENEYYLENLITVDHTRSIHLNDFVYLEFVKQIYNPRENTKGIPFDELRKHTIVNKSGDLKDAEKWLPPSSCVKKMAKLTLLFVDYLLTAGIHEAATPDCESHECFTKTASGVSIYDFGEDSNQDLDEYLSSFEEKTSKRKKGSSGRSSGSSMLPSRKRLFKN